MQQTQTLPAKSAPGVKRKHTFRKAVVPWLFLLPILLLHIVVVAGPALASVYYALTDWKGLGKAEFIGLENFRRLFFEDRTFRKAFGNNVIWMLIFLTVPIALSLGAASLLAPIKRGAMFYRTALFLPYILPSVITASIWRNLLSPRQGIGAQLSLMGISGFDKAYLGRPETALYAIAFVDNWHWWGFLLVLFLAAMQNIAPELYEAARIDGANRWHEFRYVTLPGIRPTLFFLLLMTAIWSFLVFDYVWILTQGGPAGSSEVLATMQYKTAFNRFEAGYAAAVGLTISAFALSIIGVFGLLRRRGWDI
jgi:raffinose/stachyose/melibiose transport system permease protein